MVAFAGLVLSLASLAPIYEIEVSGQAIGGWERLGDTELWIAGAPAGLLLAAAGMVLVAAGAAIIWNLNATYSQFAAVVASTLPFGIWAVVVVNFGFAIEQIDTQVSSSRGSLTGGSSATDWFRPGTGWWTAGLIAWLALIGGVGALVVPRKKSALGSPSRFTAGTGDDASLLPPPPAAASGADSSTRPRSVRTSSAFDRDATGELDV
jgi:hypothetical protein